MFYSSQRIMSKVKSLGSTVIPSDHEFGIDLTHDTANLKTTIIFRKSPPTDGTIITVDRLNDKYLKFRGKGIF